MRRFVPDMLEIAAALTSLVLLAWPFVYPQGEAPTETVNQECCCTDGGDCICDPCPCMDHGKLLVEPVTCSNT